MPAHESLRIRTPPPDSQDEELEIERAKADMNVMKIPTIIMGILMMNTLGYIYTNNDTNLYAAILCGFIWIGFLICVIYDRKEKYIIHYSTSTLDTSV